MLVIKIAPNKGLNEIKAEFINTFPFLKLEFFKTGHEINEATSMKELIKNDVKVKDVPHFKKDGYLEIIPSMTVSDLEMLFKSQFGLNVQVFRKSGTVWLETSTTDYLTLEALNTLGLEKSQPIEKTDITDIDYD